jgi:ABC-type multidrug transport system fused ATPase/permease subunit
VGILFGFAPWIVYWVLVGNVPAGTAVLAALGIAVVAFLTGRALKLPGRILELGAVAVFAVLAVLTFVTSESFMVEWLQPLGNLGIFLVALVSLLLGKPFIRDYAAVDQPPHVVKTELFARITTLLTWVWIAAFAGMTVSSVIPPIVYGQATIFDSDTPLSFICYWVVPFVLLALAALASKALPARMTAGIDDAKRSTTFVAYSEATIDELYYLAKQHADRETGAGEEAYDVRVGGAGTPLVGDEDRLSWPSTYKVRAVKR